MGRFSTKEFTYDEDYRTLTSEASTLGFPINVNHWPLSIMLFNPDNGVEAEFFQKKPITLRDKIIGMKYDNASTKTVRIYNN